jgi:hypothetical protein
MTTRRHHPSCAAASGGLCTNCPTWPLRPVGKPGYEPDITCECGETFIVTGETSEARERALAAWPGCPCTPKTASEATAGEADASGVPAAEWTIGRRVDTRPSSAPAFLSRLLGPPRFVLRRMAVWPFDAEDFTA